MPVAASVSIHRLIEAFAKLGFFPREDDPEILERPEDHLMFFPDVRDGRVYLFDIFRSIKCWEGNEGLAYGLIDAIFELGGLDD
jgi:hypothetical protein